jgi:hypothetical protein
MKSNIGTRTVVSCFLKLLAFKLYFKALPLIGLLAVLLTLALSIVLT